MAKPLYLMNGVATEAAIAAADLPVGTGPNQIVQLDGSSKLPAVDGSALTNLPAASGSITNLTAPFPFLTENQIGTGIKAIAVGAGYTVAANQTLLIHGVCYTGSGGNTGTLIIGGTNILTIQGSSSSGLTGICDSRRMLNNAGTIRSVVGSNRYDTSNANQGVNVASNGSGPAIAEGAGYLFRVATGISITRSLSSGGEVYLLATLHDNTKVSGLAAADHKIVRVTSSSTQTVPAGKVWAIHAIKPENGNGQSLLFDSATIITPNGAVILCDKFRMHNRGNGYLEVVIGSNDFAASSAATGATNGSPNTHAVAEWADCLYLAGPNTVIKGDSASNGIYLYATEHAQP